MISPSLQPPLSLSPHTAPFRSYFLFIFTCFTPCCLLLNILLSTDYFFISATWFHPPTSSLSRPTQPHFVPTSYFPVLHSKLLANLTYYHISLFLLHDSPRLILSSRTVPSLSCFSVFRFHSMLLASNLFLLSLNILHTPMFIVTYFSSPLHPCFCSCSLVIHTPVTKNSSRGLGSAQLRPRMPGSEGMWV